MSVACRDGLSKTKQGSGVQFAQVTEGSEGAGMGDTLRPSHSCSPSLPPQAFQTHYVRDAIENHELFSYLIKMTACSASPTKSQKLQSFIVLVFLYILFYTYIRTSGKCLSNFGEAEYRIADALGTLSKDDDDGSENVDRK